MEMTVTGPPKSTHEDVADLPALVALLVGQDFRVGVRGMPLRHRAFDNIGIWYS
jgi:hypothetical protein